MSSRIPKADQLKLRHLQPRFEGQVLGEALEPRVTGLEVPFAPADPFAGIALTPAERPKSIEDLVGKSASELGRLWEHGEAPSDADMAKMAQRYEGRMLSWKAHDEGFREKALRWLAGLPVFPWSGKTFTSAPTDEGPGQGVNRILGMNLFKFTWDRVPSKLSENDGKEVILLNYDSPRNHIVRLVHDEVVRVNDGLYLGKAALIPRGPASEKFIHGLLALFGRPQRPTAEKPENILYFALSVPSESQDS